MTFLNLTSPYTHTHAARDENIDWVTPIDQQIMLFHHTLNPSNSWALASNNDAPLRNLLQDISSEVHI